MEICPPFCKPEVTHNLCKHEHQYILWNSTYLTRLYMMSVGCVSMHAAPSTRLAFHDCPQPPSSPGIIPGLAWQLWHCAIARGENQEERVNIRGRESEVILLAQWTNTAFRCDGGEIWHFCFVIYKMHQESNKMPHRSTLQQDEQRIDCTDDQYLWLNSFLASCWGFWWKCESWGGSEWVQGRVRERERWRGYIGERGEGGEV